MRIGELAKRSGLTTSTIRFYESKGLLNAVSRQENGYRAYPLEAVAVLAIITNAQQTGFSLDEIKQILPDDLRNWRHDELIAALSAELEDASGAPVVSSSARIARCAGTRIAIVSSPAVAILATGQS